MPRRSIELSRKLCRNSYLGGTRERFARELQAARTHVDLDLRMVANLAGEQLASQRRLQFALDKPLQRPRAERRIVAALGQVVSRPVGQLELDLALLQPLAQSDQLYIDNLAQLVARQWMEHNDLVDAVQKLRSETL